MKIILLALFFSVLTISKSQSADPEECNELFVDLMEKNQYDSMRKMLDKNNKPKRKKFTVNRTVGDYCQLFSQDEKNIFLKLYLDLKKKFINNLRPAILEIGAGKAYVAMQSAGIAGVLANTAPEHLAYTATENLEKSFIQQRDQTFSFENYPVVVAINGSTETNSYSNNNFHYLAGRLFENYTDEELREFAPLGGYDLIPDVYGVMAYTLKLSEDLRKVFRILRPEGNLILNIPSDYHTPESIKQFNQIPKPELKLESFPYLPDSKYKTFILVEKDGRKIAISMKEWLLKYQTAFSIEDYGDFLVLTKKINSTENEIPSLKLIDVNLGVAPFSRLFIQQ
ncbi:MAG: hypothetical protein QE271_13240 [Bacteriovoracaceae bacterium]|nr:hypothetical protein [Bacteriovoracaceae bacterium]